MESDKGRKHHDSQRRQVIALQVQQIKRNACASHYFNPGTGAQLYRDVL
jgi:hypothetical protein